MPQKYITVNGVMKKNPAYVEPGKPSTDALAVISSLDDVMEANTIQSAASGITVPMAESASAAVDMLQDEDILKHYKSRVPLDGGEILDEIGKKFMTYEIPFGMLNKLLMLLEYKLDFLIDDSGSMSNPTDVEALSATEPVKTVIRTLLKREPHAGEKMTRLQEAEDRLHIMIGILAYIPVDHMQIRFLNARDVLILDRTGKTPAEFEDHAHREIRSRFARLRLAGTPVREPLQIGFDYPGKWSHYLFNDGVPNEGGEVIAEQIKSRRNPENHCLTLISCTNDDDETAWMKLVDSEATFVAEVDDFDDERDEVSKKQGPAFPFSRGLWLLTQLVASFNPYDLDALDENLPLSLSTFNNILGRQLNPKEYQYYFERNPNAALYVAEYARFLNEDVFARQIIPKALQIERERAAGYVDGERPARPLPDLSASLAPATTAAQMAFSSKHASHDVPAETVREASGGGSGGGGAPAFVPVAIGYDPHRVSRPAAQGLFKTTPAYPMPPAAPTTGATFKA